MHNGLAFIFFYSKFSISQSGGYGTSLNCQVNIECENGLCDQARGVGLIYLKIDGNYQRIGTGFLLNNERRDGRPYFMTAFHIIDRFNDYGSLTQDELSLIDSILIVFNYQSEVCIINTPLPEPDTSDFVIGAKLVSRAHDVGAAFPDWILLELKERVPIDYQVYYNGFTASENTPEQVSVIHHPKTDIKKISFYNDEPQDNYTWTWVIEEFDNGYGTIEGGSSGAPWYNENNRVIGVQSIVDVTPLSCDENNIDAGAGRLDQAWDHDPDPDLQLKYWLNSTGEINLIGMNGNDFCREDYFFENANDLHTSENVSYASGLLPGSRSYDGRYFASGLIKTGQNVLIKDETNVEFYGNKIVLKPGFKSETGSHFKAKPEPCERACNFKNNSSDDEYIYEYEDENSNQEKTPDSFERIEDKGLTRINIYPNPNNGSFTIHVNEQYINGTATLFDAFGKEVYTSKINEMKQEINVEFLSSGLYHIVVLKQGFVYREKIMIK